MRKIIFLFLSFCFISLHAQTEEYGMASYYGDEFHGGATASGEAYDKNKLTAAHKTLAMGTQVRVTRLDNKKSVIVRINDRGPYLKGRIIDLSGRAASALDMIVDGTAEVKLEILNSRGASTAATSKPKPKVPTTVVPTTEVPTSRTTAVSEKPKPPKRTPKPATSEPAKTSSSPATSTTSEKEAEDEVAFEMVTAKNYNEYDLYKIQVMRPEKKGFGVQVASFSDYSNVMRKVAELQGMWFKNILVSVEKGPDNQPMYKLILGPFPNQETANSYKKAAKKNKKVSGFVVSLEDIQAEKN